MSPEPTPVPRWSRRPPGSTWGDWGPDDELGRLNLLDSAAVLRGVEEARSGRTFCLSLPLDLPGGTSLNPNRHPPRISPTYDQEGPRYNLAWSGRDPRLVDVSSDDVVQLTLQYSTQWDSLAHIGAYFDVTGSGVEVPVYYNGFRAGTDVQGPEDLEPLGRGGSYANKLGVDNLAVAPIQGRAVLVDLFHHLGPARTKVDLATLQAIMRQDDVVVEEGDILLLRTGFAEQLVANAARPGRTDVEDTCAVLDGSDARLLEWVTQSGLVAIAADNYAIETSDIERGPGRQSNLPLHHHCLFKLGVVLGELWLLGDLADWLRAHGRTRCLLTAPPLRLPGAVGSPANPIATT